MSVTQNGVAVPKVLADDVGFLMARCGAIAIRSINQALEPLGLRGRQYMVLGLAAEGAGMSQRDIGVLLGLDPSTVVALVDELEHAGFVERQPKPGDRRTRLIAATTAGL